MDGCERRGRSDCWDQTRLGVKLVTSLHEGSRKRTNLQRFEDRGGLILGI